MQTIFFFIIYKNDKTHIYYISLHKGIHDVSKGLCILYKFVQLTRVYRA